MFQIFRIRCHDVSTTFAHAEVEHDPLFFFPIIEYVSISSKFVSKPLFVCSHTKYWVRSVTVFVVKPLGARCATCLPIESFTAIGVSDIHARARDPPSLHLCSCDLPEPVAPTRFAIESRGGTRAFNIVIGADTVRCLFARKPFVGGSLIVASCFGEQELCSLLTIYNVLCYVNDE